MSSLSLISLSLHTYSSGLSCWNIWDMWLHGPPGPLLITGHLPQGFLGYWGKRRFFIQVENDSFYISWQFFHQSSVWNYRWLLKNEFQLLRSHLQGFLGQIFCRQWWADYPIGCIIFSAVTEMFQIRLFSVFWNWLVTKTMLLKNIEHVKKKLKSWYIEVKYHRYRKYKHKKAARMTRLWTKKGQWEHLSRICGDKQSKQSPFYVYRFSLNRDTVARCRELKTTRCWHHLLIRFSRHTWTAIWTLVSLLPEQHTCKLKCYYIFY